MKILALIGLFSAVISSVIYGSYHFSIWYNKGLMHIPKKGKQQKALNPSEENDFEGLESDDVTIPDYYAENNG